MADWEEVKRLAVEFQQAQLSSTKQKLSERNVIEIVGKLINLKLIDVIYTIDGKEYITPQELAKEILEELTIHGGRINLVELQQILNIDFRHIEDKVNEMVRQDHSIMFVLGQLIDRNYLDSMAEEVNDKLQDKGFLTMVDITKQYDLPADFVSTHIRDRVGKIIKGKLDTHDRDVIYTSAFITRMKAQIRGALSAVTRPTTVTMVMHRYEFQERLFFSILEEMIHTGKLKGTVVGGRQEKAVYIPDIYTRSQNEWVDNFYRQNGYLEYDTLVRLGITDPKTFIKKRYKSDPITYLRTCCAGLGLKEQIEASVEDALGTDGYADILPLLPSVFTADDCNLLLQECIKSHTDAIICCDTIVTSQKFISKWQDSFISMVTEKAEREARSNPQLFMMEEKRAGSSKVVLMEEGSKEDRKDQRRKKQAKSFKPSWLVEVAPGCYRMVVGGSTKSGGGTQGREVKMKATKKKYMKGRGDQHDSDEEEQTRPRHTELEFMPPEELASELQKNTELRECPEELITEIANQIYRPLCREYQEKGRLALVSTTSLTSSSGRKKTHGELQEKISGLWTNCLLFEKGAKCFPEETEVLLIKHLLKTVCTDIANIIVNTVASDNMMSVSEEEKILTAESRGKLISKLPDSVQQPLSRLNNSLNGKAMDEFFRHLETMCGTDHLGILLRKPDKRKERQLIFNHRQSLLEQLSQETDPAMLLHLATVILFQTFTMNIVHAPGKCVPQIIILLKQYLEEESHTKLLHMQELIIQQMKFQGDDNEGSLLEVNTELQKLMPEVSGIAQKTKKTQKAEGDK